MQSPLIYDWNTAGTGYPHRSRPVACDDETLRDGLQSPSVRTPTIEEKIEILHRMDALGIDTADIGLPGAGPHVARGRRAARAGDRRRAAEDRGELRGAHGRAPTSRRSSTIVAADGPADRGAARSSARARSASTRRAGRSSTCSGATEEAVDLRGASTASP